MFALIRGLFADYSNYYVEFAYARKAAGEWLIRKQLVILRVKSLQCDG